MLIVSTSLSKWHFSAATSITVEVPPVSLLSLTLMSTITFVTASIREYTQYWSHFEHETMRKCFRKICRLKNFHKHLKV